MNHLLGLIEALSLLELEKIKFGVGGRNKRLPVSLFKKKKKREGEEGRLFVVEKVNDIWVMVKVSLGTITENHACSIMLMSCMEIVYERV